MLNDEYLEQVGYGKGSYWSIAPGLHRKLVSDGKNESRRRIEWDAAKTRVLSMLMDRAKRGEAGISNQEIRQVTFLGVFLLVLQADSDAATVQSNALIPTNVPTQIA